MDRGKGERKGRKAMFHPQWKHLPSSWGLMTWSSFLKSFSTQLKQCNGTLIFCESLHMWVTHMEFVFETLIGTLSKRYTLPLIKWWQMSPYDLGGVPFFYLGNIRIPVPWNHSAANCFRHYRCQQGKGVLSLCINVLVTVLGPVDITPRMLPSPLEGSQFHGREGQGNS